MGELVPYTGNALNKADRFATAQARAEGIALQAATAKTAYRLNNAASLAHGFIEGLTALHRHGQSLIQSDPALDMLLSETIQTVARGGALTLFRYSTDT